MFHVMLVLPYLLGAMFLLSLPFWIGVGLEVIISIFVKEKKWLHRVPYGLGIVGLILSIINDMGLPIEWHQGHLVINIITMENTSLPYILLYWGAYFACVALAGLIVRSIKQAINRLRRGE